MMASGRIIFLNGTSSAGKTSLAHALQECLPDPWLHVALDQFRDGLPARFRGLNSPPGTEGDRGLNVVPVSRDDGALTEIRFGETGERMLRGMRRAVVALVQQGNNVIIDDIILRPDFLLDYLSVFKGLTVFFVGVRCPAAVINQRERARPGRFPGTAIGHLDVCHAHGIYDIEVDTSTALPDECADQVAAFVARGKPTAFVRLSGTHQQQMIQQ